MNLSKTLKQWGLAASMGLCTLVVNAQSFNEGFEDITTLAASGWVMNNLSTPIGTVPTWVQGLVGGVFDPFAGTGFIQGNFNHVAGANTISNWLITPSRTFVNGDVVTFYTRTTTPGGTVYPDRLEVRLSTNGTSTNVGTTSASVGDFTTLVMSVNPTLTTTGYPSVWTQYTINVSGLPMAMNGRLAFRYFVTDGGPSGNNSDNIGIDSFSYTSICTIAASGSTTANATCNGGADGEGMASVTGASGATSYVWSNGQATASATGLAAGIFTFTATDALGCPSFGSVTITEPTAVVASGNVTSNYNGAQVSCNGSTDGIAIVSATGGMGSYVYMWSDGQTTASATGLAAGTYGFTATDANNCMGSSNVTITQPAAFIAIPDTVMNISCNGANDGAILVTLIGGTPAYTYLWSNGATTEDLTGLTPNMYSGTATDANGCVTGGVLTITEPTLLVSSATDNADGSATAGATGGTPSYTYMWDATAGNQTTATATGLVNNGVYMVTATDANGCSSASSVTVTIVGIDHIATLNNLNMFPNPTTANVFVDLDLTENQDVAIRIVNITGQIVLENNVGTVQNQRIELVTSELPTGVYMVQFFIGTDMTTRKLIMDKR